MNYIKHILVGLLFFSPCLLTSRIVDFDVVWKKWNQKVEKSGLTVEKIEHYFPEQYSSLKDFTEAQDGSSDKIINEVASTIQEFQESFFAQSLSKLAKVVAREFDEQCRAANLLMVLTSDLLNECNRIKPTEAAAYAVGIVHYSKTLLLAVKFFLTLIHRAMSMPTSKKSPLPDNAEKKRELFIQAIETVCGNMQDHSYIKTLLNYVMKSESNEWYINKYSGRRFFSDDIQGEVCSLVEHAVFAFVTPLVIEQEPGLFCICYGLWLLFDGKVPYNLGLGCAALATAFIWLMRESWKVQNREAAKNGLEYFNDRLEKKYTIFLTPPTRKAVKELYKSYPFIYQMNRMVPL